MLAHMPCDFLLLVRRNLFGMMVVRASTLASGRNTDIGRRFRALMGEGCRRGGGKQEGRVVMVLADWEAVRAARFQG